MKLSKVINKIGGYIFYVGLFLSICYSLGCLGAMFFGDSLFRGGAVNTVIKVILLIGTFPIASLLTWTVMYWNKRLGTVFLKDIF